MIIGEFRASTTREVILEEFTIETLEESHGSIYLMCDISTINILFDEFFYFFESSESFFEISFEFGFIWSHVYITDNIENPYDFSIFNLLSAESTSHIRGILYVCYLQHVPLPQEQVSQVHGLHVHVFVVINSVFRNIPNHRVRLIYGDFP